MAREAAVGVKQVENDRVIVTEWQFGVGAETGWHTHGHDYVVVPGRDGALVIEDDTGETRVELKAGQSYFRRAGVHHNVINGNDYPFSFVEVEIP
ncbi:MAG: cupin domain-containing protein [Pseudomonadota bacterium]